MVPENPEPGNRSISVRVIPRSSRPRIETTTDGGLRVYVSSAPKNGKANTEVKKAVARHLGVSTGRIVIVKGAGSRDKLIRVVH